ncbi:hypothetical protein COLO4_37701 [Corchorus olitorius]|uniref:Uncharacterized protein n=1 Tax=Corchorus olitorius TaxID=93759 RepID=A0A1R3FZW1_9ROSI|nr:hypothetical protein COLO4_37701 [Corchorus olitorius]
MDVSIPTVNFNRHVSTNPTSCGYRNRDFSRFPDNKSSSPAARPVCHICDRIGHLAKSSLFNIGIRIRVQLRIDSPDLPAVSTDVAPSFPAAPHSAQSDTAADCGQPDFI